MSILKRWIANLLVIGLGLLTVCPIASAQSVFDDPEPEAAPPKAEWRQKALHNNKGLQQINRASAENTDSRTVQWSPNQNSNQDPQYRMAQRSAPENANQQDSEYRAQRTSSRNSKQNVQYNTAQRSAYQSSNRARPSGVARASYAQPKSVRVAQREVPAAMEEEPGAMQYEPLASEGSFAPQDDCGSCGGDCGDCGECGDCDCPWMAPCGGWGPRNLAIFAGVHGFKGPRDRGGNGNFGFNEGLNFGAPLGDPWGCGYQLGFSALQSNISGYQQNAPSADSSDLAANASSTVTADRHQYFFTAGVFNRAENAGWQWGVVFDLLHDTYYEASDLKQIRTETGYLFDECNELGYSGAYGVGGDRVHNALIISELRQTNVVNINAVLNPTDQFVVYYRRHFENGGDARVFGGLTGYGDGLFGADGWIPLGGSWAVQNSFNYLIPKKGRGDSGQIDESWSVSINLVWYPGRSAKCLGTSCYRPLLNVADNSLFMVREDRNISVTTSTP
jgi:hypothetical protein